MHKGDFAAAAGGGQHSIALVFGAGFIQRGIHEFAFVVFHPGNGAVNRRALRMHVEHIHKHADFQRFHIAVGVEHFFHHHNAPVGRTQHGIGILRNRARRVAEKLQGKGGEEPKRQRPPAGAGGYDDAEHQACRNKRPAFAGDNRVRVKTGHNALS